MVLSESETGRMLAVIDQMGKTLVGLEAKVDALTISVNDMKMAEAKRQGVESVAKWLIGILGGAAGAILSRLVHF